MDRPASVEKDLKTERLVNLIKLMSNDKSALIFENIFLVSGDRSDVLRKRLKLTRKQYYTRISRLIKVGLVRRQKGGYFPTAFGRVFYDAQNQLDNAIKNYWKLKAIDSLGVAYESNMPEQERKKIIDQMTGNQQIKEILLSEKY
jgi:predicted transcriptional regulator